MIDAHADVTVPVSVEEAFTAAANFGNEDWLPSVRGLHHAGGPATGVGARYEVEAGFVGRHLKGVLVCREYEEPHRIVLGLEEGLDLTITITTTEVSGGCHVDLGASYSVAGPFGSAVERASAGAARREVARAMENFAARFGRKQGDTAQSA